MGKVAFRKTTEADQPIEVGSTIPRMIRMGLKAGSAVQPTPPVAAIDTRASQRFVPRKPKTVVTMNTGKKLDARIINISETAVAVEANFSMFPVSAVTFVGARPVKPGRKIALGAVFLFVKPLPSSLCNDDLVL